MLSNKSNMLLGGLELNEEKKSRTVNLIIRLHICKKELNKRTYLPRFKLPIYVPSRRWTLIEWNLWQAVQRSSEQLLFPACARVRRRKRPAPTTGGHCEHLQEHTATPGGARETVDVPTLSQQKKRSLAEFCYNNNNNTRLHNLVSCFNQTD